ncbi:MAG: M48 family metallopeptidase [Spirochaetes bacterium]|nr:M48 family metallopeptidase [Spirochaetota bacterium]
MIHRTEAIHFDGVKPRERRGQLIYDAANKELHFYEIDTETQTEKFAFSLDKNHGFEIRTRLKEQLIEWRVKGNHTSALIVIQDLKFTRLVRDKYLSHKNIFWRYATYVWSESFGRVIIALAVALAITGVGAHYFMENSYHLIPVTWDKKVGDQAEAGLKEFGAICTSAETVRDLRKFLPYFREAGTTHQYDIQILKSPVENAFALPGGKITVFSATVEKAKNYEELAGILAHEVGHVERRHGMQQLSQYMTLRLVLTLAFGMTDDATILSFAADAGALLLLLKNSRDHERDADAFAARKLAEAGISSKAIREFFERINKESKSEISSVPDFVLTHPADEERIRFFEQYEKKNKAQLRAASERLNPEIRELLAQKPVISAACRASTDAKQPPEDEEEKE